MRSPLRASALRMIRRAAVFACLIFCLGGATSFANETSASYAPVAFNVWAGLGGSYEHDSGSQGSQGTANITFKIGLDVGVRFSRPLSIVVLADYQAFPTEPHDPGLWALLVGPGLRYEPDLRFQFTFAAGYVRTTMGIPGGPIANGFGVRANAFFPLFGGFGPYAGLGFNAFSKYGRSTQLVSLTAGISYSF
jgi:hypothetical protein